MIKLIASDMDGTLLDGQGNINNEFFEVFNKLRENNIVFAAASGRQYYNLLKRFESIKDDMMFIAENGTFVVYKGKEILLNSMDWNVVMELVNIGRKIKNSYVVLCGKKSAYIESNNDKLVKEVYKYYEKYEIVEDLSTVKDDILKVTICDFIGSEINSNHYFKKYKDILQISVSGEIWLDITNLGANKGVAIKKIQDMFNIEYNETMVFGDYLNDIEMMDSAYYSYAMDNAHDDLKNVARFKAKSNLQNGVVEKVKEVVLNNLIKEFSI